MQQNIKMSLMTKTLSVYGGAGGKGTCISSYKPAFFYEICQYKPADDFTFYSLDNNKTTMQNLNDRLAFYIQKVQSLKSSSADLQRKINEWSASRTLVSRDYSAYLATIKSLQDQIQEMSKSNKEIVQKIKNANLAAEDFQNMYKTELAFRRSAEMDTAYNRKEMDEITLSRSTLEMEYESLMEECILLQKTHKEEKAQIQAQAEHQVNISIDAAPSTDLYKTLTKIRERYEDLVAKNRKSLEAWYQKKISALDKKFTEENDDLKNATTEVRILKTKFHKLQIERESQESLSLFLKASLQEYETRYGVQLANFQKIITDLKSELKQIHANITAKKKEYDTLESEIKQYSLLLEAEGSDLQVACKKITVVKVVERRESITIQ
ncbi:hypothetical protein QTP70_023319 [Hemibagrus guttatus]|uniref:IF rod domain-containing protein n=1 Tax=Hemibagrus guttatus TaxID=175788 RepID=A0AAE0V0N5_9TELE|nr:hypothetical protein QTP70_023319 [Hemibagrus guttatus]